MLVLGFALLLIHETKCLTTKFVEITKVPLKHINELQDLAQFDDAQHRGPHWYDYSVDPIDVASSLHSEKSETISISAHTSSEVDKGSHDSASDTDEKRQTFKRYRTCHPCPEDMLKKYTNIGIKWICAAYQNARRSFKSQCMLRYRNCQDGTMFVKIHEHKCRKDPFHGRSWFYGYKV
ncbi:uncharacterized protein LOC118278266 [Spodoptera frugiperda]|uniref:Uncharacterized protein LOC118278266 n=1 Tax=Spodoptera frugiperda TaxID=7108 RepID=A0A9R0DHH2_SPOFR|nr:uncharacterized protein LOC118278266 [Spodoptera frugiperda]